MMCRLVILNILFYVCLPTFFCCKSFTNLVLYIFKFICISLGMMEISHPQIWHNLGVIFQNCGVINDLNVVSLISNFCFTESNTFTNPLLVNSLSYNLVLYADNDLLALIWATLLQQDFDTLKELFDSVGLHTNVAKTVSIACQKFRALVGHSAESYRLWMTGELLSVWDRVFQRVCCTNCNVYLAEGST